MHMHVYSILLAGSQVVTKHLHDQKRVTINDHLQDTFKTNRSCGDRENNNIRPVES